MPPPPSPLAISHVLNVVTYLHSLEICESLWLPPLFSSHASKTRSGSLLWRCRSCSVFSTPRTASLFHNIVKVSATAINRIFQLNNTSLVCGQLVLTSHATIPCILLLYQYSQVPTLLKQLLDESSIECECHSCTALLNGAHTLNELNVIKANSILVSPTVLALAVCPENYPKCFGWQSIYLNLGQPGFSSSKAETKSLQTMTANEQAGEVFLNTPVKSKLKKQDKTEQECAVDLVVSYYSSKM